MLKLKNHIGTRLALVLLFFSSGFKLMASRFALGRTGVQPISRTHLPDGVHFSGESAPKISKVIRATAVASLWNIEAQEFTTQHSHPGLLDAGAKPFCVPSECSDCSGCASCYSECSGSTVSGGTPTGTNFFPRGGTNLAPGTYFPGTSQMTGAASTCTNPPTTPA